MEPLGLRKNTNHPYHLHILSKVDTREVYAAYQAKWRCDACQNTFDGNKESLVGSEDTETEEPSSRHAYHCARCKFDLCTRCFRGHLHPFHHHRLKKARTPLIYPETNGQWRCDACKRIFSALTNQSCYHCEDCETDLCDKCFKGEWDHVLHGHPLKPVDPRLEYRVYNSWQCDSCNCHFTHGSTLDVLFHCTKCDFDLCTGCFLGQKHHLHQHKLIRVETDMGHSSYTCSHCLCTITDLYYHRCCDSTCPFTLCSRCHASSPKLHPAHPAHPLERCDAGEVYPQTGGMWHCDNCTQNHPNKDPFPLPPSEPMYHCEQCEFDLCESCYQRGLKVTTPPREEALRPVQVEERMKRYSLNFITPDVQARHMVTGTQPLSYLTSPLVPPHRLCTVCRVYHATMTFVCGGTLHSEAALCCERCASEIMHFRRPCPACGQIPHRAVDAHPP